MTMGAICRGKISGCRREYWISAKKHRSTVHAMPQPHSKQSNSRCCQIHCGVCELLWSAAVSIHAIQLFNTEMGYFQGERPTHDP